MKSFFLHSYPTVYFSSPCGCTEGSSNSTCPKTVLDFLSPTTSIPHLPRLSNDPTSHSDPTVKKPGVIFVPLSSLLHTQVFRKSSICTKTSWIGSFLHLHFHHHWAGHYHDSARQQPDFKVGLPAISPAPWKVPQSSQGAPSKTQASVMANFVSTYLS